MRVAVCLTFLLLCGCGFKTFDEANGTNNGGNGGGSVFTNNTTVVTVSGDFRSTVRQAGTFRSSTSTSGLSPFTTETTSGTFTTTTRLAVPVDTAVSLKTVLDASTGAVLSQHLLAADQTVAVSGIASFTPSLNAGQSITLGSSQSIFVPSGSTLATATATTTIEGHGQTITTSAGAVLRAPGNVVGATDNLVTTP